LWPSLPDPGRQPNRPFLESRLPSKSLEPFIGLIAYLELKLWVKNKKLEEILPPQNANLGSIPPQAIIRQPIELESCSNALKMGKVL